MIIELYIFKAGVISYVPHLQESLSSESDRIIGRRMHSRITKKQICCIQVLNHLNMNQLNISQRIFVFRKTYLNLCFQPHSRQTTAPVIYRGHCKVVIDNFFLHLYKTQCGIIRRHGNGFFLNIFHILIWAKMLKLENLPDNIPLVVDETVLTKSDPTSTYALILINQFYQSDLCILF